MKAFFGGGLQGAAILSFIVSISLAIGGAIFAPIIGIPIGIYLFKRGKGLIQTSGDKWRD